MPHRPGALPDFAVRSRINVSLDASFGRRMIGRWLLVLSAAESSVRRHMSSFYEASVTPSLHLKPLNSLSFERHQRGSLGTSGRRAVKVAPLPASLSITMRPRWRLR